MRWQKNIFQTKEQDKTPEDQLSGDKQSTQERVQSNDHKDDPRTQENNRCTEREVTRVFNKEFENIKNNQTVEEYNN